MKNISDWNVLQHQSQNCNSCILRKTCHQVVWGDGAYDSDVLIIGEAPGKQEDIQGKPFAGAAGKFLNTLLESIGWNREKDVFITNIVKCRPPENRDPEPNEKKTCSKKWLSKQIETFDPKIIVTLGRHSGMYFLPDLVISKDHGQVKYLESGQIIYPLYHPAAALYNGSLRETLLEDMKKLPLLLKTL
jgi:uracil-DNA glycosylase